MSHSQFRCSILNWHMHGLIFKTSICNWQDQPGYYPQNGADQSIIDLQSTTDSEIPPYTQVVTLTCIHIDSIIPGLSAKQYQGRYDEVSLPPS